METVTKIINVTENELAAVLANIDKPNGQTFWAYVHMRTPQKDALKKHRETKEPNPYTLIEKESKFSFLLNSTYQKAVENQLEKEGKDKSEYKKGRNTMPLQLCENNRFFGYFNGNAVLQYRPNDNKKSPSEVVYWADGKPVTKDDVKHYLPIKNKAKNQGTSREIPWEKVYLKNLVSLTIFHTKYVLIK